MKQPMNAELAEAFVNQAKSHLKGDFLPKVCRCVELLSDEEVWWRANQNTNSVGNLILHLCGNVRQWIIAGLGQQPDRRQRDQEFAEKGHSPAAQLMEKLDRTVNEALDVLNSLEPDTLSKTHHIQVYDVTGLQAIFHVVEHFSYHTGQIIYITRMIKNIDLKFYQL